MALLPDIKDEAVRLLHPRWRFMRAYYLVVECSIGYAEVGHILSVCSNYPKGGPYHPDTIKKYVKRGKIEVSYSHSPIGGMSQFARSYLVRRKGFDLTDANILEQVRAFARMYSALNKPTGCGEKSWKEIIDAIQ